MSKIGLPESPEELKKLIKELEKQNANLRGKNKNLEGENENLQTDNKHLQNNNDRLKERVLLLERHIFARKSEKWTVLDKHQMYLFDEAEAVISDSNSEPE
jgi:predicted nuclease with TOPRIM domain